MGVSEVVKAKSAVLDWLLAKLLTAEGEGEKGMLIKRKRWNQ